MVQFADDASTGWGANNQGRNKLQNVLKGLVQETETRRDSALIGGSPMSKEWKQNGEIESRTLGCQVMGSHTGFLILSVATVI